MSQFLWRPGHGPDAAALERMRNAFPKPTRPMGEAWFMTEKRKMYPELMTTAVEDISTSKLQRYLWEIGSGISSFGPLDGEWSEWFHYLLPRLIETSLAKQALFGSLAQDIISAFVPQYPEHLDGPYPDFRRDIFNTLGTWLMASDFWEGDDLRSGTVLPGPPIPGERNLWHNADGTVSAVLFFCWKYLRSDEIDAWAGSVFAIKDAHWTANLLVWLLGIQQILSGEITQPADFERIIPDINWEANYYLKGRYDGDYQTPTTIPFLSQANIDALQAALKKYVTEELFFEWLDSFANFDHLKYELYTLPDQFASAYLIR